MSQVSSAVRTRELERDLVVRERAERHRLAARFRHRRRHDGAVAVVDRGGPSGAPGATSSSPVESTATLRSPHDVDLRDAAGRQHADLARADARAAAQHHFAARDVGARVGNELAGRTRAAYVDRRRRRILHELGLLDHDHRIGAARHDAAGRDRGRGAGSDLERRRVAADDDLAVEREPARRGVARARVSAARSAKPSTLARSNGGTSIGAITSSASTRPSAAASCTASAGERREIEMTREARARFLRRRPRRETAPAAPRGGPQRETLRRRWAGGLTGRSWPRSYHDLRAGRISFAVGGNEDPSVGLRERRERP